MSALEALLAVDLPDASELETQEDPGDFYSSGQPDVSMPVVDRSDNPLISRDEATRRLGPKVLAALSDKFNGKLTDIRYPDENDMLF